MEVTLYVDSNGTHLHQIYTGLFILDREGMIDLKLRPGNSITSRRRNRQFLAMRVDAGNGTKLAVFDLSDFQKIGLPDALSACDFYFKRSLTKASFSGLDVSQSRKLKPFGFNYQVIEPSKALFLKRVLLEYISKPYNPFFKKNRRHLRNLKELFDASIGREKSYLLNTYDLKPKILKHQYDVLFQCRLWDPLELDPRNREDAEKVNSDRIAIVKSLKDCLGERFVGGLQPSEFSMKIARELVVDDPRMSQRRNYLSLVQKSSLVVSSSGLLGSNGWKLGEYIALGKAIVSDPILTKIPGRFEQGTHYEGYSSPEACSRSVLDLLSNRNKIENLAIASKNYYEDYLSPKQMMWNHIKTMTEEKKE